MKALFMTSHFKTSDYYEILKRIAPELDHSHPGELKAKRFLNIFVFKCFYFDWFESFL